MEKRLFIMLFLKTCFISWALLQEKELAGYLFGDFRDTVVYFKNGIALDEKIDYNLLDKNILETII